MTTGDRLTSHVYWTSCVDIHGILLHTGCYISPDTGVGSVPRLSSGTVVESAISKARMNHNDGTSSELWRLP